MEDAGSEGLLGAWADVGHFLYLFAQIETEMDHAIRHLTGADEDVGLILAANVTFAKKIDILKSGINAQEKKDAAWKEKAIKLLNRIHRLNDERILAAHSSFEPHEGGVRFQKTIAKEKLNKSTPIWARHYLDRLFKTMSDIRSEMQYIRGGLMPVITASAYQILEPVDQVAIVGVVSQGLGEMTAQDQI